MTALRTVLALTLLAIGISVSGAPAPLPRRPLPCEDRLHPSRLWGVWVLTWWGNKYVYDFRKDGTYVHLRWHPSEADFSGTWEYHKGVLTVHEHYRGRPEVILTHVLEREGEVWVQYSEEDPSCLRSHFGR